MMNCTLSAVLYSANNDGIYAKWVMERSYIITIWDNDKRQFMEHVKSGH